MRAHAPPQRRLGKAMNGAREVCAWSILIVLAIGAGPSAALAAPTAEVAKRCIHYSYIAYPFKRPGAVHMSGDRQAYFQDCIAKNGDVPTPTPPQPAAPAKP